MVIGLLAFFVSPVEWFLVERTLDSITTSRASLRLQPTRAKNPRRNPDTVERTSESKREPCMSEPDPFSVIDTIIAAWKADDLETVLAQLTDDVEMIYAIGQKPLQGKAEVREMLSKLGGSQTDVRWRILNRARAGAVVFVEGIDDFVNAKGHRVQHPYVSVYEFEGGRVRRWRDYFDLRTMLRSEEGKPPSKWVLPLVSDERKGVTA